MMKRHVWLALVLCMAPLRVMGDHMPRNLVARGPAETMLAGIDIHHSHVKGLLEKLGKPASYKRYPETEEAAEVIWEKDGSRIHATINVDDVAYAVEVSGKPGPLAVTGSGLTLGGTMADLQRVYGSRFLRKADGATLQWRDGTELRVKLVGGKIVSMLLLANVE